MSSTNDTPTTATNTKPTDYTTWTHSDLISRVSELERQLRQQNATSSSTFTTTSGRVKQTRSSSPARSKTPRRATLFDPSKYSTRHIALKIAYLGQRYNGFEHANGNVTARPTIEEVLWKALRKARLISPPPLGGPGRGRPPGSEGPPGVEEESTEIEWHSGVRARRGPIPINWEGYQYSKCGRTDKGVSAFGQVVGVRVRSNRPIRKKRSEEVSTSTNADLADLADRSDGVAASTERELELPSINDDDELEHDKDDDDSFDSVKDELPYISIINSILPPDIRVLAWCPNPPEDFDARFSCAERRYKYFFTNPAFLPTPGPTGMKDASGKETGLREGWLDIDAMREGAKKLVGLHDFRNFCRIDPSKQLTAFDRRITHVDVEEVRQQSGPVAFFEQHNLARNSEDSRHFVQQSMQTSGGPKVYSFTVHGSAFLWHQVRHMVAVLFLIGQRLDSPSLVDELLDIEKNRCRPTYEMASDAPLVLWDCIFPTDKSSGKEDGLDWIYAGDARGLAGLPPKGDSKFSVGGVVDEIWSNWRKHKIDETLSSTLLDLVIGQGDGSALQRGGFRDLDTMAYRSQKLFDGSENARLAGRYIPVMQKPKMDSVDVQNAKYREGKGNRREIRRAREVNGDD